MKRARHIYGRPSVRVSFPTALLGSGMSPSETYVYVLLLDRAASAAAEETPKPLPGEAPYFCFPVEELAEALHRSPACIKLALSGLEKRGLITRELQGGGMPYRIRMKPFDESREA